MIAIYPGTFDPPTNGHFDIIRRSAPLFDSLIVGIARNVTKNPAFTEAERLGMLTEGVRDLTNVSIVAFDGLVAEYARKAGAGVILRGVRSVGDYEYELQMAIANRNISGDTLETFLMVPSVQHSFLSSRLVKEAAMLGADVSSFVPPHVFSAMQAKYGVRP